MHVGSRRNSIQIKAAAGKELGSGTFRTPPPPPPIHYSNPKKRRDNQDWTIVELGGGRVRGGGRVSGSKEYYLCGVCFTATVASKLLLICSVTYPPLRLRGKENNGGQEY